MERKCEYLQEFGPKKTPFLLGFYRVGEFKTSDEEQESGGDGELTSAP